MDERTWVSPISKKEELGELISLAENGDLQELFIAQCVGLGVAGQDWKIGQILIFSFSLGDAVKASLDKIAPSLDLDAIAEEHFEEIDGHFALKYVLYPQSEEQEEQIIAQLL